MKIPLPPAPISPKDPIVIGDVAFLSFYTHEQMIEFGKKCAEEALLQAAKICENGILESKSPWSIGFSKASQQCADAIREEIIDGNP